MEMVSTEMVRTEMVSTEMVRTEMVSTEMVRTERLYYIQHRKAGKRTTSIIERLVYNSILLVTFSKLVNF